MNKSRLSRDTLPAFDQLSPIERRLGRIDYRSVSSLTAYQNNPKKHSEKQIVQLMASIREFGFALPVLIDSDSVIVAGQACIEAARRLGMDEVPVLVADQWSKAQVRAYRLMDNKLSELATWDLDLLTIELSAIIQNDEVAIDLLGWDTAEIDLLIDGSNVDTVPDQADEIPNFPKIPACRAGDLWILETHRLYCGYINPGYVDVAILRWEAMTGKLAVLAETDESFAEVAHRRQDEARNAIENSDDSDTVAG